MTKESRDEREADGLGLGVARVVARTDGTGAMRDFEATEEVTDAESLAASLDIMAAAIGHFGESRSVGSVRSALLVYDGIVVAMARDGEAGNVAVLGNAEARQGLVLSQLHRVLAKTGAPPEER